METVPCRCSNFTKFTTKHLPKALFEESCLITPCSFSNKGSLSQVFSCEFCEFFQNIVLQATYGFVVETSLCLVPTEAKPFLKNMISLFLNQAVFDLLVMKLIWSLFIKTLIYRHYLLKFLRFLQFISRYDGKRNKKGMLVMVDLYIVVFS